MGQAENFNDNLKKVPETWERKGSTGLEGVGFQRGLWMGIQSRRLLPLPSHLTLTGCSPS